MEKQSMQVSSGLPLCRMLTHCVPIVLRCLFMESFEAERLAHGSPPPQHSGYACHREVEPGRLVRVLLIAIWQGCGGSMRNLHRALVFPSLCWVTKEITRLQGLLPDGRQVCLLV